MAFQLNYQTYFQKNFYPSSTKLLTLTNPKNISLKRGAKIGGLLTHFQNILHEFCPEIRNFLSRFLNPPSLNHLMLKIGLISDTHGFLDPSIYQHFNTVDEIWHAGDLGQTRIINDLKTFKPLRAVWGNIDGPEIRHILPETERFRIEGINVLMTHIGGYPGKYRPGIKQQLIDYQAQLFITGHSHILKIQFDPSIKCLHMNPGAAGNQGWQKVRTLIRFTIDGSDMRDCEVIELGKKGIA